MSGARGDFTVKANGKKYKLWLGLSVLADLQEKHGQDALQRLETPEEAGPKWVPPLAVMVDVFLGALQRYHADEADRYLVDDILAQNPGVFAGLMAAAFPDQKGAEAGNGRKPKRAA